VLSTLVVALLVLFLVTVFTLALVHLFPGGPIRSLHDGQTSRKG